MASDAALPHDPFSASTAPLTFAAFLEKMRQPGAADIVKAIKAFLSEMLTSGADAERDAERVQARLARGQPCGLAYSACTGLPESDRGSVHHAPALAQRQCGGA